MEIIHDEPQNIVFLITTALLIALAIYVFRFVWVYLLFKDFYYPNNVQSYLDDEEDAGPPKRNHYAFIMTMCGIHGTISLSMALTLPFMMDGNQEFIYRNDLLFIASFMVLTSLISLKLFYRLSHHLKRSQNLKVCPINQLKYSWFNKYSMHLKRKLSEEKYRLSTNIKSIF